MRDLERIEMDTKNRPKLSSLKGYRFSADPIEKFGKFRFCKLRFVGMRERKTKRSPDDKWVWSSECFQSRNVEKVYCFFIIINFLFSFLEKIIGWHTTFFLNIPTFKKKIYYHFIHH